MKLLITFKVEIKEKWILFFPKIETRVEEVMQWFGVKEYT